MSAVPLPALVLAGTSEAPSRVAFIFSAKAGPAKAIAAPSASVASMVLVFDIGLSLLASSDGASLKQQDSGFIPEKRRKRPEFFKQSKKFFKQSKTGTHAILTVRLRWTVTDR